VYFHDHDAKIVYELPHLQGIRVTTWAQPNGSALCAFGLVNGEVRVGPVTGENHHLLLGHKNPVKALAMDPKGRWVASGALKDSEIRLWPIPEGVPFHTLDHDEFLDKLRALTNMRAVPDTTSDTGYRIDYSEFPGWEKVPTW
jgi:WD40 repeat protein